MFIAAAASKSHLPHLDCHFQKAPFCSITSIAVWSALPPRYSVKVWRSMAHSGSALGKMGMEISTLECPVYRLLCGQEINFEPRLAKPFKGNSLQSLTQQEWAWHKHRHKKEIYSRVRHQVPSNCGTLYISFICNINSECVCSSWWDKWFCLPCVPIKDLWEQEPEFPSHIFVEKNREWEQVKETPSSWEFYIHGFWQLRVCWWFLSDKLVMSLQWTSDLW